MFGREVAVKQVKQYNYVIIKRSWFTMGAWIICYPSVLSSLRLAEEQAQKYAAHNNYKYCGIKTWWISNGD